MNFTHSFIKKLVDKNIINTFYNIQHTESLKIIYSILVEQFFICITNETKMVLHDNVIPNILLNEIEIDMYSFILSFINNNFKQEVKEINDLHINRTSPIEYIILNYFFILLFIYSNPILNYGEEIVIDYDEETSLFTILNFNHYDTTNLVSYNVQKRLH